MNTLRELLAETPAATEQPRVTPIREEIQRKAVSPAASVQDEQIRALVQQLFFRHESSRFGTSDLPRSKLRLRLRHYASKSPKLWLKKTGTTLG